MRKAALVVTSLALTLAFLAMAAASYATTEIPGDTSWRHYGDPPDGVQRNQVHEFRVNPNDDPPENTYNGFEINPDYPDLWTFPSEDDATLTWDVQIGDGQNPFVVPGTHTPYGDGYGLKIEAEHSYTFSKRMGNLFCDYLVKQVYVYVFWYAVQGEDPYSDPCASLSLGCTPGSDSVFALDQCVTDIDGNWNLTRMTGTITPQPDWETFTFEFTPGPSGDLSAIYIDRVGIKTVCVPEPGVLPALCVGLLGFIGAVRRRRS